MFADVAKRRMERPKLIPKNGNVPGLNLPNHLFLLDGRQLHKVTDFRFKERKFPLLVFEDLEKVDKRNHLRKPEKQLDSLLGKQKKIEWKEKEHQRKAQMEFAVTQRMRLHFDEMQNDVDLEESHDVLMASKYFDKCIDVENRPYRSTYDPQRREAIWKELSKPR